MKCTDTNAQHKVKLRSSAAQRTTTKVKTLRLTLRLTQTSTWSLSGVVYLQQQQRRRKDDNKKRSAAKRCIEA